jgi:hypothetical protein
MASKEQKAAIELAKPTINTELFRVPVGEAVYYEYKHIAAERKWRDALDAAQKKEIARLNKLCDEWIKVSGFASSSDFACEAARYGKPVERLTDLEKHIKSIRAETETRGTYIDLLEAMKRIRKLTGVL